MPTAGRTHQNNSPSPKKADRYAMPIGCRIWSTSSLPQSTPIRQNAPYAASFRSMRGGRSTAAFFGSMAFPKGRGARPSGSNAVSSGKYSKVISVFSILLSPSVCPFYKKMPAFFVKMGRWQGEFFYKKRHGFPCLRLSKKAQATPSSLF